jgi:hypothetical protein
MSSALKTGIKLFWNGWQPLKVRDEISKAGKPKQRFSGRYFRPCAVWFVLIAVTGCAGLGVSSKPEVLVAESAKARWHALIDRDLERAYGFLSPASRQAISLDAYRAKTKAGMWREANVKSVVCEDTSCKVTIAIVYDHRMMKGVRTDVQESWLIEDGKVWYVFEG